MTQRRDHNGDMARVMTLPTNLRRDATATSVLDVTATSTDQRTQTFCVATSRPNGDNDLSTKHDLRRDVGDDDSLLTRTTLRHDHNGDNGD
jgi:hypothetical protein